MIDEVLNLAMELIRYPSVTPHDRGCQEVLMQFLTHRGFTIQQYPHQDTSNFWAIIGHQGPVFCFAGHTDVVATGPLNAWDSDPFTPVIRDDHLWGRGAADMKGGLAAMCVASDYFLRQHPNFNGRIAFLITSAEEGPSETGTPIVLSALKEQNIPIDYCLIGEPTAVHQAGDMIKHGRRGSLSGRLTIKGKQGHIAYPQLAKNPIHAVVPALNEFIHKTWDKGSPDFQPTSLQISNIHAGTGAGNVIPGDCVVDFNFRYAPVHTGEALMEQTQRLFDHHSLNAELQWDHSGKPFITRTGRLLRITRLAIEKIVQIQPELSTSGGTSDGRFIADYCPEVIECGVSNATIHQINECVSIHDLEQITRIYYEILSLIFEETT